MSGNDLQLLRDFRADTPEPDHESARRIYRLATGTPPSRRPRRLAFRVAAFAAGAIAVAVSVLGALPGEGPTAVARAAAVLNPPEDTILHTVVITTRSADARAEITETWQLNAPPYDQRSVAGGRSSRGEDATVNGRPQYYDARTNTIYTVPAKTTLPAPTAPKEHAQRLLELMRTGLASGEVREEGRVSVAGRDAVRLVSSAAGKMTMLVDAETYEPIEWSGLSDDGSRLTSRFRTYELLPATRANLALLSLTAQHPSATIEPSLEIEGVGGGAK